jgi:uncharacterized protein GlcG (DUF336 family)
MSISVVDEGAQVVAFVRLDGVFLGSIDVAHRKARTAALFETDSGVLGPNFHPNGSAYSLENSNGGLIGFGGGVVLRDPGKVFIGAVGVSGGSVEQDEIIAQAAATALAD